MIIQIVKPIIKQVQIVKCIMFIGILASSASDASDLGVHGQTYKIAEESFIAMMKKNLDGIDIKAHQEKMQAQAKNRVENPIGSEDILPATKSRTFHFDPTYILPEDAVLPCGKVLHKAGTTVNPLEYMELNRRLFFIDSRQPEQLEWLKNQLEQSLPAQVEDRVILIAGSVFGLKESLGAEHSDKVYFDQAAELTTKFGIKASPAIVMQDELMLKVEEIGIK